ncbi:MAG: glycosyl hydrolase [Anaerolineae bacterium]
MTQPMYRRVTILAALLITALSILAFALGEHPGTGLESDSRLPDRGERPSGLKIDLQDRGTQFQTSSSKLATITVHVPLVLRNWESIPHSEVVWGTQFGQDGWEPGYDELVEHDLPLVQAAGFTSIRTHLYWREVEPANAAPANYNWSKYDRRLRDFRGFGLEPVVGIVAYPRWATRYYCGGGLRPGMEVEWREFVRALAQRYSAPPYDVHIWEIGNEVDGETEVDPEEDSQRRPEQGGNQPTWHFGGCWGDMVPEYVSFLRAAYEEIKAIDPTATVTLGGLAYAVFEKWFIRDFFDNFLAAGGADYTDVVGFHWFPYRQPWPTADEKAQELRDIMAAHGVSKPLWLTETYMWDREGETDTRDLRVTFITQDLVRAMGSRAVERIYWFGVRDFNPAISTFDRGLITPDHEPKPGLKVFEIMADFVAGYPRPPAVAIPSQIEAYRFVQPRQNQETWAMWSITGEVEAFILPISGSSTEAVTIQVGDTYTTTNAISNIVPVENGQITLSIDHETLFLRVEKANP